MKKTLFILLTLIVTTISVAQDTINWRSFEKAIALNKTEKKPILIFVYTNWCGFCKKMEIESFANLDVVNLINNNFYAVKLNAEGKKDITYKDYTFKYRTEGKVKYHELAALLLNGKLSYPTTLILTENEQILHVIGGYVKTSQFKKIITTNLKRLDTLKTTPKTKVK